jgi:tetraacyldisaccharide 4'-kinase
MFRRLAFTPLSWIYSIVTSIRNLLFDKKIIKSYKYKLPVISVGNLSTGGTGKTPHIEYLLQVLKDYHVAVLSRGYGRKSKGFLKVNTSERWDLFGDEPVQFKLKFPQAEVFVCENRVEGINRILNDESIEVILLDDAFQHRYVVPGLQLLLTDYSRPWFRDRLLPAGSLRESASGRKRASLIIVSKAPEKISSDEKQHFIQKLKVGREQPAFFSYLSYGQFRDLHGRNAGMNAAHALIVTGIANPQPMIDYLRNQFNTVEELRFPDHHSYTQVDAELIRKKYLSLKPPAVIITTEKDAVRLHKLADDLPVYVLPVQVEFTEGDRAQFASYIKTYVGENQRVGGVAAQ